MVSLEKQEGQYFFFLEIFYSFPRVSVFSRCKTQNGGGVILLGWLCRYSSRYHRLQIDDSPGKGFRIMHGFSTIINCSEMGDNCLVSHNVTIGWGKGGTPKIGNNVEVYAGAIICGGISVGDNVKIGAGAVVTKDIPSNCTVVGNPARIIQ